MIITGKSFIVTGGLGAIGRACAKTLLDRGANVAVFDVVDSAKAAGLQKELGLEAAIYVQVDITDVDATDKACRSVLERVPKGSLAGGIHCAGIAPGRQWTNRLVDSAPDFRKVFKINAEGTFNFDAALADAINSQYPDDGPFAPRVTEERGCIINIASVVARPVPGRCLTYGPSKTAVLGITEGMADFLGPSGIRVNSVSPAVVASALMGPDRLPYFQNELESGCIFPRRVSDPLEVADACAFMISNSMMNDTHLRVDGGWRGTTMWHAAHDPRQKAISLE
ncbi:hypothetical protein Q5752_006747 [Cryptotrichosporon argae]